MRRAGIGVFWRLLTSGVVLLLLSTTMATAQAPDPNDGWAFRLTPYLWLAGLSGKLGVSDNLPTASVDADFGDILSHLDAGIMAVAEARHGNLILLADVSYVSLSADAGNEGPVIGSAKVRAKSFNSTIEAGYRLYDSPAVSIEGLAGIRIFSVSNEIEFSGGALPSGSPSSGDSWVDPVIGTRVNVPIAAGFSLNAYGDLGGFGIASDWTWQVYGGLDYQITDSIAANAGYRYLDVHHQDGGFTYDVAQQGPLLGLGVRF